MSRPLGFFNLHPDVIINYQLNRCMEEGQYEDLEQIAPRIMNFSDWKREMFRIADLALKEGRILHAACYYRYAGFFADPADPDKKKTYDKFVELSREGYKDKDLKRYEIPYGKGYLPAVRITPGKSKGVVVISSGFDTFLEEYYPRVLFFSSAGYDVICFNGPGQGEALIKHKLYMTPEWEKPVAAILDYFGLDNVSLIGISLGGYLGMRAAAFEPRIRRVVAYDVFYDFLECMLQDTSFLVKTLIRLMLKANLSFPINAMIWARRKREMIVDFAMNQSMFIMGVDTPYKVLQEMRKYNLAQVSGRIEQDVLVLAGSEDHYVPLNQFYDQLKSLTKARSITGRIFTRAENAQNHCQYGNSRLALETILNWLDQFQSPERNE